MTPIGKSRTKKCIRKNQGGGSSSPLFFINLNLTIGQKFTSVGNQNNQSVKHTNGGNAPKLLMDYKLATAGVFVLGILFQAASLPPKKAAVEKSTPSTPSTPTKEVVAAKPAADLYAGTSYSTLDNSTLPAKGGHNASTGKAWFETRWDGRFQTAWNKWVCDSNNTVNWSSRDNQGTFNDLGIQSGMTCNATNKDGNLTIQLFNEDGSLYEKATLKYGVTTATAQAIQPAAWDDSKAISFCMNEARTAASPRRPDFGFLGAGDIESWETMKTVMIGFKVDNAFGGENYYKIECKEQADGTHKVVEINRLS